MEWTLSTVHCPLDSALQWTVQWTVLHAAGKMYGEKVGRDDVAGPAPWVLPHNLLLPMAIRSSGHMFPLYIVLEEQ
jgi:hypothetical protein